MRTVNKICLLSVVLGCLLLSGMVSASTKTMGRVLEVEPAAVEVMASQFDQVLALFFKGELDSELEKAFQSEVEKINSTYPADKSLFIVVNVTKDFWGKLSLYKQKTEKEVQEGFKLITEIFHYSLNKSEISEIPAFYAKHAHPVMPILEESNYAATYARSNHTLILAYNSSQNLEEVRETYKEMYDYMNYFEIPTYALSEKAASIRLVTEKGITIDYPNTLYDTREILDFVNIQTIPLVSKIGIHNQSYVRVFGSSINKQFLFLYSKQNENSQHLVNMRSHFEEAALINKQNDLKSQRIIFAEGAVEDLEDYFDESVLRLADSQEFDYFYQLVLTQTDFDNFKLRKWTFPLGTGLSPKFENLGIFIDDVRMKRINEDIKSEIVPKFYNDPVVKIVARNFNQKVFENTNTSVLVLFIDTKDPKSYQPLLNALHDFAVKYRELLKPVMTIATFDLNKNEHQMLTIKTAPELVLFNRHNKKETKYFKGHSTANAIKDWINVEASDISIPENYGEKPVPIEGSTSVPAAATNEVKEVPQGSETVAEVENPTSNDL